MAGASEPSKTTHVLLIAQEAPPQKSVKQEAPPEKVFAESLRNLVRDELQNCGFKAKPEKETLDLQPLQVVFLLAFALDLTFLYLWVAEHSRAGEVWDFLSKLIPALCGTLALSYFDRLRRWLLDHSRNPWIGSLFLAPAVFFLVTLIPIYSLVVRVDPPYANLTIREAETTKEPRSGDLCNGGKQGCFVLSKLKLRRYSLEVTNTQTQTRQSGSYRIGGFDVLLGCLARLPLLHGLEMDTFRAKYTLSVSYKNPWGVLYVSVNGDESPQLSKLEPKLWPAARGISPEICPLQYKCWQKPVDPSDQLNLPQGNYTFTQYVDGGSCLQTSKQVPEATAVSFFPSRKDIKTVKCGH
jgi:hypothetical protein